MKVVLFGTGLFYELYRECFSFFDVVALADNDERKQNTFIDGVRVIAPSQLVDIEFDRVFILIASASIPDMKKQLNEIGIPADKVSTVYDIRRYCDDIGKMNAVQVFTNDLAEMIGRKNRPRICVIHPVRGLSINGVDTCLIQLCKVLVKHAEVHVVLSRECELIDMLLKHEVTVVIDRFSHVKRLDDVPWEKTYDLIFVNSVDMFNVFDGVTEVKRPVIWWLHTIGEAVAQVPLERLKNLKNSNIHVYAVSPLTELAFHQKLPQWEIGKLFYGIEEHASHTKRPSKKMLFAIVGRCSRGKGHDIIAEAVKLLPQEVRNECEFWLVGYMNPKRRYEMNLLEAVQSEPCIKVIGPLYGDDLKKMYENIDVLLCPSRADAMPIVCAEAMMHYRPCIVSENVGTKFLIKDKENGLICKTEDPVNLRNKIEWCVNNRDKIAQMGKKARIVYENNFTMSKFEENIMSIINELCK